MDKKTTFGTSPAFFLSLYGEGFTPGDVCQGLETLCGLGLTRYQGEIVADDKLALWLEGGAKRVRARAEALNIAKSQFVAHFLIDAFADTRALESPRGVAELDGVMRISETLGGSNQITVPIGSFRGDRTNAANRALLVGKLRRIERELRVGGFRLALEIQPGALVQGEEAIGALLEEIGGDVGFNLDTGHAWAAGCADLALFPKRLGTMIFGTHLCDNNAIRNDSLRPGTGTIAWRELLSALWQSGYAGSLDLEIFCRAQDVRGEYAAGLSYLRSIWGGDQP